MIFYFSYIAVILDLVSLKNKIIKKLYDIIFRFILMFKENKLYIIIKLKKYLLHQITYITFISGRRITYTMY